MKPKSIPKQARKWIEHDRAVVLLVSGALATLHVPFVLHLFGCIFLHFPFINMHLPCIVHSFPFIVLSCFFIGIHFHSCSFHIPFIFIPMCIHVLSASFHLDARMFLSFFPFILYSCPLIPFLKVWKSLHGLAREPSATHGYPLR